MTEPATADLIAELLLRYYRDPRRYRAQVAIEAQLIGDLGIVLRLSLGRSIELANPVLHRSAVSGELQRAAKFYVEQQFFRDDASHYDVLGLAPEASPESIRENYRLMMQLIHPDRHADDTPWPESYAARVNQAHSTLKNAQSRNDYDKQRAGARALQSPASHPEAVVRPRAPTRAMPPRRSPPTTPMLPEWLTAGFGGFVRSNPGLAIFGGLIIVCAAFVGTAVWPEHDALLPSGSNYTPLAAADTKPPIGMPLKRPATTDATAPTPSTPSMAGTANAASVSAALPSPADSAAEGSPATPVVPAPETPAPSPTAVAPQPPAPPPLPPPAPAGPRATPPVLQRAEPSRASSPAPTKFAANASAAAPPTHRVATAPRSVEPVSETMSPALAAPVAAAVAQTTSHLPPTALAAAPPAPTLAAAPQVTTPAPPPPAAQPSPAVATAAMPAPPSGSMPPPAAAEVEALIASFISNYEGGRTVAFANLFDDDAQANQHRGRAAIRSEYDELFRTSAWRRMNVAQMRWQPMGERTQAKGEVLIRIAWRDGRETEQRMAVDMDLVRQGGRAVIARLSLQPRQ